MANRPKPTKVKKIFFWIILGLLSTFFAEVIAGSTPYPFFSILGLLFVTPLYFLHTLFFMSIIYRYGKPTLAALYAGGLLFGMYEAYITKVIWTSYSPTGPILSIGGIAVFETLLLVLFWHSVFAFTIPVFLGETYLTRSKEILGLLPRNLLKKGKLLFFIFIIFGGAFTSVNSPGLIQSLTSPLFSGVFIFILIYFWKKTGGTQYEMRELLPSKKTFKIILGLMVIMYISYTLIFNFDKLPGFFPQAEVLMIYGLLIWLLIRILKHSRSEVIREEKATFTWKKTIGYLMLFVGAALVAEFLNMSFVWTNVMWIILSYIGIVFPGLFLLIHTIKKALKD